MAAIKVDKKKRKRSRKARTDVSSSSSSSSSSDSESSESSSKKEEQLQQRPKTQPRRSKTAAKHSDDEEQEAEASPSPKAAMDEDGIAPPTRPKDAEQLFDDFYLKQGTKEFANDLDTLRSAGDFGESSVPILIDALKQGRACFTAEERRKIAGGDGKG